MKDHVCKVPVGMSPSGPPTLVIIEEIVESSLDSEVSALKEQALLAIKGSIH